MKNLGLRLLVGFVGALVLSILPLPEWLSAFRPPWVLLLILYIEYYLPGNFRLTALLFTGLLLDVLMSSVIGEHSFALLLVTWIASTKSRRFQFFSMMQQICLIGFFCLLYQSVISFIDGLLGFHYSLFTPLASALLGMFFWPWIRLLGDGSLLTRLVYR
ncbi:rod shape-determining protein MreD [Legionella worsleiensis]|uniref:Rod shape-determining protein MreD n=1 Tax=Legionella worsleiensis TaxID=45076 RepID=A0A0W1A3J8_9GAMM|nr:rod shape-determining protein MreD [Legionella worsleiensis]KTD75934.1 Rod shape-determining protein MreD [Legionella worsleiensis]STY32947.1 Rod shape-determining protein MreD [Legionella worsleiensis]